MPEKPIQRDPGIKMSKGPDTGEFIQQSIQTPFWLVQHKKGKQKNSKEKRTKFPRV